MAKTIGFEDLLPADLIAASNIVKKEIVNAPELRNMHQITPNVRASKKIVITGEMGLIGKASQGCGGTPQSNSVYINTDKYWAPKEWEFYLRECWKDYAPTFAQYSFNKGVKRADLTSTDILNILLDKLTPAIKKMFIRFVWFGDTAANAVDGASPAGILTSGTDETYFTLIDGIWKQARAIIAAAPARKINIAANEQTTYALQKSTLTPEIAWGIIRDAIFNTKTSVRYAPGIGGYATQYLFDMACQWISDKSIPDTFLNMVNGVKTLKAYGTPITAVPIWSEIIETYEDNGTYWNDPHRLIIYDKTNVQVACDGSTPLEDVVLLPNPYDKYFYMEGMDTIDAKIIKDDEIQVAI